MTANNIELVALSSPAHAAVVMRWVASVCVSLCLFALLKLNF